MGSQINVPQLDHLLQLAQGNLVLKVYTIFINESSTAQLRRISGKVLAELLYDSEGNCQIIEELANKDSARPIINTLECPDTVLSFFASAILRRL
ncbi:hypothetical protein BJX66DRAFT_301945 [Aspergillus keveii]|uniref:Uncharacterized protein n=1 Tax=Aspergillus keveii TaxID=714993 RepID=A0ABR4G8P4_9EURO